MRFHANFLQAALLNLAGYRFLADVRGVLVCDVDELVIRRDGAASVFDATLATRSGFLRIPDAWRYLPASLDGMPLHRDHAMRTDMPRSSPPKYCVVRAGACVLFGWRFIGRRFRFLHCYGISDFWEDRPSSQITLATEHDAEAERALARSLD